MKKTSLNILTAFAAAVLMTGCSDDFLDQTPKDQYTVETFYTSDAAVRKGTEPLYNRAWFSFNRNALIGMGSYRANDAWSPYLNPEFARFTVTGLTPELVSSWSSIYNVVTLSNATMKNIKEYCSGVTESVKRAAIGECYLMRGWAYFYLLRGWGANVLIADNQTLVDNPVQPLNTEASVLEFIIRDFRQAAEYLPDEGTDHHPSKYAAKAALAKALLAKSGWDATSAIDHQRDTEILKEVVSLCDEVIEKSEYRLMDDYEELFRAQNNDNSETILAMRWADPNTQAWGACNYTYATLCFSEITDVTVWGGSIAASTDMLDFYNEEPGDSIRRRASFFTQNTYYSYLHTDVGGYTYKNKYAPVKKGVLGKKCDVSPYGLDANSPLYTYIQRLADVYLIKAEAILGNNASTSDPEALAAINAVRLRAGAKALTSFTLEQLIRERRIEFCMEYTNWWDMVTWYRWKPNYMLNYFNNKQHRACQLGGDDVIKNADGTLSYRCRPPGLWYLRNSQGNVYWNDFLATSEDDNTPVAGRGTNVPYTYNYNALVAEQSDYLPVVLTDVNIFMPYPETDVLQNALFNEAPVDYDFGQYQ
ncbi:MAG: RagB/SusD family nutrient uptake outer membrane protein [Prevotella sp.]